MRLTKASVLGAALVAFTSLAPVVGAVAAEGCTAAVEAAKAEWRGLSKGRFVAPAQTIVTSDGRRLAGSAINYAWVLIDRADSACSAGNAAEAVGYAQKAETLFHPSPRQL